MASRQDLADYLLEQLHELDDVRAKRMFGEFGIYVGDRFVALICDDELFVKDTPAGRACFPDAQTGIPFPGAKPWLQVPGERWEDTRWLVGLLQATAGAVPPVKPSRPRSRPIGTP